MYYMVLKNSGKGTKYGRNAVVVPLGKKGKNLFIKGNIPELYHGMFVEMELDDSNFVLDYSLELTDKNIAALEKAGIDVEEYSAVLERHSILKKEGVDWNTAKLNLDEIYNVLPFNEADKVHKEMVNNASEPTRIEAINKEIIAFARQKRKIAYKIEEFLSYFSAVEQEGAYEQLMLALKLMCLNAKRYNYKDGNVWDAEMKAKVDYINDSIDKRINAEYSLLTKKEIADFIESVKNRGLAKEQLSTLWCLKNSTPCIITGGAGVGKTTVIQTLIDCYAKFYSNKHILLVAPTGKASRRLAEKTKMPACTIHKALRKNPEDDYTYYTEDNPLPHRLIIVDESSMVDTALMYDLLSAINPTSKIIFVGDHNQLYPVGYGEPFFDLMQKLETFKLTINHRQGEGTDILDNANRVLQGKELYSGSGVTFTNITFNEVGDVIQTADENTQIISPYNSLNALINDFLKKGDADFNMGDKVMTVKNTKEYSNGDIGYIRGIDTKGNITVEIDGRTVKITKGKHDHLSLAYAVTVHKMQGSESERIIFLLPADDKADKRMLYTAFTRARTELEVYHFTEE